MATVVPGGGFDWRERVLAEGAGLFRRVKFTEKDVEENGLGWNG